MVGGGRGANLRKGVGVRVGGDGRETVSNAIVGGGDGGRLCLTL